MAREKEILEAIKSANLVRLVELLNSVTEVNLSSSFFELHPDKLKEIIGPRGGILLAKALRENHTVTYINLYGCCIGAEGAYAFAETLRTNHTLTGINFQFNNIGAEGIKTLVEALKVYPTMSSLFLGQNNIGDEGACKFAELLETNRTLTYVSLRQNSIRVKGACALAKALERNSTLASIDLFDNRIGVEGACALAKMLEINCTLVSLDLWQCELGLEGLRSLATALQKNHTVTVLNLQRNDTGTGDEWGCDEDIYGLLARNVEELRQSVAILRKQSDRLESALQAERESKAHEIQHSEELLKKMTEDMGVEVAHRDELLAKTREMSTEIARRDSRLRELEDALKTEKEHVAAEHTELSAALSVKERECHKLAEEKGKAEEMLQTTEEKLRILEEQLKAANDRLLVLEEESRRHTEEEAVSQTEVQVPRSQRPIDDEIQEMVKAVIRGAIDGLSGCEYYDALTGCRSGGFLNPEKYRRLLETISERIRSNHIFGDNGDLEPRKRARIIYTLSEVLQLYCKYRPRKKHMRLFGSEDNHVHFELHVRGIAISEELRGRIDDAIRNCLEERHSFSVSTRT